MRKTVPYVKQLVGWIEKRNLRLNQGCRTLVQRAIQSEITLDALIAHVASAELILQNGFATSSPA